MLVHFTAVLQLVRLTRMDFWLTKWLTIFDFLMVYGVMNVSDMWGDLGFLPWGKTRAWQE
jgi:hypothetical protein